MPNLCCNLLSIPPRPGVLSAHIDTVIRSLRGLNGPLDFETILPIPADLQVFTGAEPSSTAGTTRCGGRSRCPAEA